MNDYLGQPLDVDPVIEAYKKDVDVTLLIASLRLTPAERLDRMQAFAKFLEELRGAAAVPSATAEKPR